MAEVYAKDATKLELRQDRCRAALRAGRSAPLTAQELTAAARIAWRNHSRCIGRLYWRCLHVRDRRGAAQSDAIFEALAQHLALADNGGQIRSVMTVFAPRESGTAAPRIWNHQLCGYAGYRDRHDHVLGDPRNVALTEQAVGLGWQPPKTRSAFDLLPWIIQCVRFQEEIGLDMLVHGEFERNDMVEYFGEQLDGFAFTENGWVQSYGSRYVKPPIIYGDVARPRPMTMRWSAFAQSLTRRPMKGMLTGPITVLQWSFVRDDQPRRETAFQIALALRDEVLGLEQAGIAAIQIDEPALREGLPLRREDRKYYLEWAVNAFRLSAAGVRDDTQIHTHMCYAEFNDIIHAIAALDADVITIETSRSNMELLEAFVDFKYPNEIGPGVYDIHSPRVPTVGDMEALMAKAAQVLPIENLWVNPDCGLKTRGWAEVKPSLANMVEAARALRQRFAAQPNPAITVVTS